MKPHTTNDRSMATWKQVTSKFSDWLWAIVESGKTLAWELRPAKRESMNVCCRTLIQPLLASYYLNPCTMPVTTCKTNAGVHPSHIILENQQTKNTRKQIEHNDSRARAVDHIHSMQWMDGAVHSFEKARAKQRQKTKPQRCFLRKGKCLSFHRQCEGS